MEKVGNMENGKVGDHSVEVINDVQVIDYSKGKSLHVRLSFYKQ